MRKAGVSGGDAAARKELLISKHPGVNGVICLILAVILVGAPVAWFSLNGAAGALVGPGLASLVLALLSVVIGVLAFRLVRRPSGARRFLLPLRLLAISGFGIGVAGAALGLIFGGLTGSTIAVGAGMGLLVVSFVVVAQGALVYGAATTHI